MNYRIGPSNWNIRFRKKLRNYRRLQHELIHVERIASLGKLSSSVAHEINNPLSGILIYSKLIYKQLSTPEFYHARKDIHP